jgi:bifunctional DNase/RNase
MVVSDVRMELSRIIISENSESQVIVLTEKFGQRSFPILIGIHEALAIDRRLKGIRFERPLTHQLLANVIRDMGGTLERIVVCDLKDHTFFAKLCIRAGDRMIEVDSRPSDAIAVGIASDVPIFVAEHILAAVT